MNILDTILIATVEGVTEFLPISSTGHMIIVSDWLGMVQSEQLKALEVIIQFFAILAIVFIYREKVRLSEYRLWAKTFVGFLPVAIVGLIFADHIKALFTVPIVASAFIVGGVALLFAERLQARSAKKVEEIQHIEEVSWMSAFKIGLFQLLALIPGMSRSGATIFGGMALGMSRTQAAEFSFLLAVPVTLAVTLHDFVKYYESFSRGDMHMLAIASILSFITAYVSVKLFMQFIERFSLASFGVYRIIFGVLLLLFFV